MRYSKPQLIPVGKAARLIQSSLDKNALPPDAMSPHTQPTSAAAYESDE